MKIIFTGEKDFEAYCKAEAWAREHNYHYGSMERDEPIGISDEEWIGGYKWKHLSQSGKADLSGIITSGDMRNGDVTVIIFDSDDANPYLATEGR